jgi:putative SOS response-associated peptidase YedK
MRSNSISSLTERARKIPRSQDISEIALGSPDPLYPADDRIQSPAPAPVIRRREDGVELVQLRWGFPPARPKGAPVINFRSEGRHFPVGRCLIPATHFFEFTGKKAPKSKWKFTKVGEDWFCFAGLWRSMPDGAGEAFTLLTTEPGPDGKRSVRSACR